MAHQSARWSESGPVDDLSLSIAGTGPEATFIGWLTSLPSPGRNSDPWRGLRPGGTARSRPTTVSSGGAGSRCCRSRRLPFLWTKLFSGRAISASLGGAWSVLPYRSREMITARENRVLGYVDLVSPGSLAARVTRLPLPFFARPALGRNGSGANGVRDRSEEAKAIGTPPTGLPVYLYEGCWRADGMGLSTRNASPTAVCPEPRRQEQVSRRRDPPTRPRRGFTGHLKPAPALGAETAVATGAGPGVIGAVRFIAECPTFQFRSEPASTGFAVRADEFTVGASNAPPKALGFKRRNPHPPAPVPHLTVHPVTAQLMPTGGDGAAASRPPSLIGRSTPKRGMTPPTVIEVRRGLRAPGIFISCAGERPWRAGETVFARPAKTKKKKKTGFCDLARDLACWRRSGWPPWRSPGERPRWPIILRPSNEESSRRARRSALGAVYELERPRIPRRFRFAEAGRPRAKPLGIGPVRRDLVIALVDEWACSNNANSGISFSGGTSRGGRRNQCYPRHRLVQWKPAIVRSRRFR